MGNKPIRQAFLYTFIITACVVATALAFFTVDQVTGQTLHGADYTPTLPAFSPDTLVHGLPPRIQGLLKILQYIRDGLLHIITPP